MRTAPNRRVLGAEYAKRSPRLQAQSLWDDLDFILLHLLDLRWKVGDDVSPEQLLHTFQ